LAAKASLFGCQADQPVTSVPEVESSTVVQVVGQPTGEIDADFEGGLASGYPFGIGKNHFLLLDRRRRTISLYCLQNDMPPGSADGVANDIPTVRC
jgi:hypothetical protein